MSIKCFLEMRRAPDIEPCCRVYTERTETIHEWRIDFRCHYPRLQLTDRSETRVADYILKHKPELPYIMSKTLADACQVSEATITRFCRSVGCASFNDFKVRRLRPSPPTAPPARPADTTSMVTSSWRTPWSKNAKSYTASALRPCNRRWTCWITARSARWWTASMRRIMCTASARATLPS